MCQYLVLSDVRYVFVLIDQILAFLTSRMAYDNMASLQYLSSTKHIPILRLDKNEKLKNRLGALYNYYYIFHI
jgi:hypothetical protein